MATWVKQIRWGDKGKLVNRHQIIDKIMTLTTPIWDSKAKRLKPRMTIAQATSEVWITSVTYHKWLKEDKLLAQMVEDVKNSHRQMMDDMAESIILEWLNGWVKLRPSEKIGFAFRYLEKTSQYYNPTQKLEVDSNTNVYSMTEEEILDRIKELTLETWETVELPINIKQEDVTYNLPDADIAENEIWESEETSEESPIDGDSEWDWD